MIMNVIMLDDDLWRPGLNGFKYIDRVLFDMVGVCVCVCSQSIWTLLCSLISFYPSFTEANMLFLY